MKPGPQCVALVKYFESLHDGDLTKLGLQPKLCPAGVWTIGYGHVVIDPKTGRKLEGEKGKQRALELHPSLTAKQAEALLMKDLEKRAATVRRVITVPLLQREFDALVSFEFNTGAIGAQKTIVRYLNGGMKGEAVNELRRWVFCKGYRLKGLINRRENERLLFLTGKWQQGL